VVLDEATASIDADNERLIGEALSELCRGKTVIVIAHRLGTVQAADRIVVLDKGRVEAVGTHEELMKHCGLYRHLVALNDSSADWSRGRVSVDAAASEEKEVCYD
jgi:ATP-binding cassette subfamily B protein